MARKGGSAGPGPAALAALALLATVMLVAHVAAAPVHGTHRAEHLKDTHKLVRLAAKMRFAQEANAINATDAGASSQNTTAGSGAASSSNTTQSGTNTTTQTGTTGGNTTTPTNTTAPTAPSGSGNATSNVTAGSGNATVSGNVTASANSTANANSTTVAGNGTADANTTATANGTTTAANGTSVAGNSTVAANSTEVAGGANATNATVAVQSASASASGSSSVTPITPQSQQQAQQQTKAYVTPTYTGLDESKPRLHCPDNVDCSGPHHWTTDRARLLFSNIYAPAGSNKYVPKYKKAIVHTPDPDVANRHQVDVRPGKVKKEQNAYGVVDETQGPSQESSKEYVEPLYGFSKDVSCLETDSC